VVAADSIAEGQETLQTLMHLGRISDRVVAETVPQSTEIEKQGVTREEIYDLPQRAIQK